MKSSLLLTEFAVLFLALPILLFIDVITLPLWFILLICTLYCFCLLWIDRSFERKWLWNVDGLKKSFRPVMVRAIIAFAFLGVVFALMEPESLFAFMIEEPKTWMLVMVLYPLLSVLPQELIYRSFLTHRYREVFKSDRLRIHISALAFAFVHIIYMNYPAVFLTYGAGYLFARTYHESRSLLAVAFEHAVYGCFIFTIGLGKYFYLQL
jgi:uncharacterized protein